MQDDVTFVPKLSHANERDKRVSIALPGFCLLIPTDLTPKVDFEQAFQFSGTVIQPTLRQQANYPKERKRRGLSAAFSLG